MMAMMFLFWLLVIAGFIIGLRWLLGKGRGEKDDAALKILRERYARGEINKAELKANSGQIFKFGSQPGILIRTSEGDLRAFTAICTHLACIVQYRSDLSHIWCACHNGHFDLNGKNITGPPPRPLEPYVVNVRGDQIVVRKAA